MQVDGAAASTILRARRRTAIIGADRIADNGDSANKIGSVGVALAAAGAGIPFVVAAPTTTVDPHTATGDDIEIELRSGAEVTALYGTPTAPAESPGFNPAFDVTPARLIQRDRHRARRRRAEHRHLVACRDLRRWFTMSERSERFDITAPPAHRCRRSPLGDPP